MTVQLDLFSGEAAKEEGIHLALAADRTQDWLTDARAALTQLANTRQPFTADDLVTIVGLPDEGVNRNNAVGALINGAARSGLIVKTGRYVKGQRKASHARMLAEWVGR